MLQEACEELVNAATRIICNTLFREMIQPSSSAFAPFSLISEIVVKIMVHSAFSFKVTKIYLMQKIGREKKIPSFHNIISEKEVQQQRSSIFVVKDHFLTHFDR